MATARAIREGYDVRLDKMGLSLNTASLLAYIDQFGPVNQTRAAEHLGQGRAATGSQVDRLEMQGMLKRVPDPSDRRVWLLETTPEGKRMVAKINKVDKVFRDELRVGISRSERQQLASLLVRLQHNLRCDTATSPDTHSTTSDNTSNNTSPAAITPTTDTVGGGES